ncbi:hypothetical protein [Comamonas sp. JC664]|uniref:hypothetical protein n=1 Tax=Comamonas sp. JC664 TaxID=2801917 RepID=UPI0036097654
MFSEFAKDNAAIGGLFGGDIYREINNERENLFDDEVSNRFFENLEFNTSLNGFENGECWQELREKSRLFLTKYSLLDNFDFPNPMKFSEFLYPDDFEKYDPALVGLGVDSPFR